MAEERERELDCTEMVRILNSQVELPTRMNTPRSVTAGGTKSDDPVIGIDDCWCGRPGGHDWVGKEAGAAHPRDPESWQDAYRRLPGGRS